jgi:hypothetical protein
VGLGESQSSNVLVMSARLGGASQVGGGTAADTRPICCSAITSAFDTPRQHVSLHLHYFFCAFIML